MYHLLTNYEPDPIQTPTLGSILAKNPKLRTVQVGNKTVCLVERVIIKAMQQEPAERFKDADAMRNALQQCLPTYAAPATVQIPAVSPQATIIVPVSGLICPKCGYQNRPGAKFCKRDGQPLVQGATTVPPQVNMRAAARAPIQARPMQQPIRSNQPIRARPVAVSSAPNPDTAYRLGLQNLNSKNYVEAVNQFKIALSRPSYDVLYNLGRAYRQYGQSLKDQNPKGFKENLTLAAEQFEEATRVKPDALDAYFQLGMCYRDLELYDKASNAFKKALQLAPKDPANYYQLGMVSMEQGYNHQAEAYFLEGLKIKADHALILIALGRLYGKMRQNSSAITVLRQATKAESMLAEGWYELGRAHMQIKEWKQALSALEQARQRDPGAGGV